LECWWNYSWDYNGLKTAVLWFRVIVVRIRGSMPLTNGSGSGWGSGSCYFRHWLSRRQQKIIFLKWIFCLFLFEGTLNHFSKIKSQTEVTKVFLLNDRRIRIRTSDYRIRILIQEAQKQMNPDPQHCLRLLFTCNSLENHVIPLKGEKPWWFFLRPGPNSFPNGSVLEHFNSTVKVATQKKKDSVKAWKWCSHSVEHVCRWFRFAQLAKGKKFRP
jgi:hypothetical protein